MVAVMSLWRGRSWRWGGPGDDRGGCGVLVLLLPLLAVAQRAVDRVGVLGSEAGCLGWIENLLSV